MKVVQWSLGIMLVSFTAYSNENLDKLQFLANLNKRSPHEGAVLYQLDAYHNFSCAGSASLSDLKKYQKTKTYKALVLKSQKRKAFGINTIKTTFQENEEAPLCQN